MKFYLAVVSILFTCFSCNPANQLQKNQQQYQQMVDEYIKNHPVRIDTTTKFSPGPDSSHFYKSVIDSLTKLKAGKQTEIETKYKDTCKSALDRYDEGFDFGYLVGLNSGKQEKVHDTLFKTIVPTGDIELLKKLLDQEKSSNGTLRTSLATANGKTTKYFWMLIASCLLSLLLLIALLIKIFR